MAFAQLHETLRRGDIIGVVGAPGTSNTGELSILTTDMTLLSACLHVLPARDGLKDQEYRYRHRWVDLISNPRVSYLRGRNLFCLFFLFASHDSPSCPRCAPRSRRAPKLCRLCASFWIRADSSRLKRP